MTQLTDTQSLLLAHAARREDGSLYPLPTSMIKDAAPIERTTRAILQLTRRALFEERETQTLATIARANGDLAFGIFITPAGLTAIGVDDGAGDPTPVLDPLTPAPARQTKTAMVLALLQRGNGATLAELIDATGWLPHTTRAALTGLRKKGHAIDKTKRGEATCYKVAA